MTYVYLEQYSLALPRHWKAHTSSDEDCWVPGTWLCGVWCVEAEMGVASEEEEHSTQLNKPVRAGFIHHNCLAFR